MTKEEIIKAIREECYRQQESGGSDAPWVRDAKEWSGPETGLFIDGIIDVDAIAEAILKVSSATGPAAKA